MYPNRHRGLRAASTMTLLFAALLISGPAAAEKIRVTVENLSPRDGLSLTPVWIGFHDGEFDTFNEGEAVSEGFEALTEDGLVEAFEQEFTDTSPDFFSGVVADPSGLQPLPIFEPNSGASEVFDVDPNVHMFMSFASMVIPSNDAFIANEDPQSIQIFDDSGNFLGPITITVTGAEVFDAGTELNDETGVAFLDQLADTPGLGTDTDEAVARHPGFNGSLGNPDATPLNILGATNPLGFTFDPVAADFTAEGYEVARITVTLADDDQAGIVGDTTFDFVLTGSQENPPVDTDALGTCTAVLSEANSQLTVNCTHDVQEATAAHIHLAEPGVNGDAILPFDSAESPISQTFDLTQDQIAALLEGKLYVNVHSTANPEGEIRGQIAPGISACYSGNLFGADRIGEGLVVEVGRSTFGPQFIASWYTYEADGSGDQLWLHGVGDMTGNQGTADMITTRGGEFGEGFDPETVETTEWGTVTVTFFVDGTALVEWDSVLPEYGSGSFLAIRPVLNPEGFFEQCVLQTG